MTTVTVFCSRIRWLISADEHLAHLPSEATGTAPNSGRNR
jgi:hypothetical protein